MANNLARSAAPVDFSEADPYRSAAEVPSLDLRRGTDKAAAAWRIMHGKGTAADYLLSASRVPEILGNNLVNAAVSGFTAPGAAYRGELPVQDPETGHASDEAIRRSLDLAGLASSATLGKAPGAAGAELGSGAMRKATEAVEDIGATDLDKAQWGQAAFRFRGKVYTDDFHAGAIDKFLETNGYKKAAEGGLDDAVRDMPDLQEVDDHSLGGIGKDGQFIPFTDAEITKTKRRTGGFFANKSPEAGAVFLTAGRKPAPVFYSAVERAVDASDLRAASGDQWLATLKNAPGVKGEEIEWLGLAEALKDRPGANQPKAWTKAEVQQAVKNNKVNVEEHWKGGEWLPENWSEEIQREAQRIVRDRGGRGHRDEIDAEDWQQAEDNVRSRNAELFNAPKFFEYQLPGGENYRELLLTLPEKPLPKQERTPAEQEHADLSAKMWEEAQKQGVTRGQFENGWIWSDKNPYKAELTELNRRVDAERRTPNTRQYEQPNYISSHWDEPNVLAHVRMNDRELPAEGFSVYNRASGNKSPVFETRAEAEAYKAKLPASLQDQTHVIGDTKSRKTLFLEELQSDWHQTGRKQGYGLLSPTERQEHDGLKRRAFDGDSLTPEELQRMDELDSRLMGVPDAPFKRSWPQLLLHRMVREAAENGYDQIAWTDGATQAERYDLSKHVQSIEYDKEPKYATDDPDTWVNPPPEEKHDVKLRIEDKNGHDVLGLGRLGVFTWKEVTDTLGKEIAEKIQKAKDPQGKLEGLDLKVGGEGMRGFYDDMLPKIANKAFGKLGGKVRTEKLPGGEIHQEEGRWFYHASNQPEGQDYGPFLTRAEAERIGEESKAIYVLPITPQMREHALSRGFPLFSSGVPMVDDTGPEGYNRDPIVPGVKLVPVDHQPEFK